MKILVIGGTGNVGAQVVKELQKRGHDLEPVRGTHRIAVAKVGRLHFVGQGHVEHVEVAVDANAAEQEAREIQLGETSSSARIRQATC